MTGAPASHERPPPGFAASLAYARRTLALVWTTAPGLTLMTAGLVVIAALLPAAALYVSKLVVDGVVAAIDLQTEASRSSAIFWVAVEAGLLALLLAARRLLVFVKARLHAELGFAVSLSILRKAEAFSLRQMEDADIQQQLAMARQFATSRPYGLVNRILDATQHGLTLISMAVLLAGFSPWLILLIILGGLPLFVGNLKFSGTAYRFYTGRTPQMRERNYLESLVAGEASARERIHYRLGPEIMRRFQALFGELYRDDRQLQSRQAWAGAGLAIISSGVFLGGKVWIVWETIAGVISLGQMTMLVGLLKQGQNNVTTLLNAFNGIVEDVLYVSNLYALLELPEERRHGGARAGDQPGLGLQFEDVSFTYPGRDKPALSGVSFAISPGQRVGIVGANGSGKSTLVKLSVGLYQPDSGIIRLDGRDVREWDRDVLSRRIGLMFQPHANYKFNLRDNIAAGDELRELDDVEAMAAAEAGLATGLINDLPHGLEQKLGKRFLDGIELSGGQWQRLAMARAFINKRADILILDEPTAAMDPEAEAEFIRRDHGGKTVILISHRLSNLVAADQILVLEKGRLAEMGAHAELVEAGAVYARLFELQARPYRD